MESYAELMSDLSVETTELADVADALGELSRPDYWTLIVDQLNMGEVKKIGHLRRAGGAISEMLRDHRTNGLSARSALSRLLLTLAERELTRTIQVKELFLGCAARMAAPPPAPTPAAKREDKAAGTAQPDRAPEAEMVQLREGLRHGKWRQQKGASKKARYTA
jgi:hypothetical protein